MLLVLPHAIERYRERVKQQLTIEQAADELERLLPMATITRERPVWTSEGTQDSWAVLTDAIAFPIERHCVMSCLTRGEVGAELRITKARKRRERSERNGRPGAKKKHGKVARDSRRRARAAKQGQFDD